MTTKILVRPLQSQNAAAWHTLWDGYNAFYGREGVTALPADVAATTWGRFFNRDFPLGFWMITKLFLRVFSVH